MVTRRNTLQRQLILDAIRELDHPAAEEIFAHVQKTHPHISKATVYRNLNLLYEENVIGKVETGSGASDRFDRCAKRHPHLLCRVCGRAFDADMPPCDPTKELNAHGFCVEDFHIEFVGVCPDCIDKQKGE